MSNTLQRILVVDENIFARICSAILMLEGYEVGAATAYDVKAEEGKDGCCSLLVTSYPYCCNALKELDAIKSPLIILTDQIDTTLISLLQASDNVFCMVKPIDYGRFKTLVRDVLLGQASIPGGFNVF